MVRLEDIAEGMDLAGLPGERQCVHVVKSAMRGANAARVQYVTPAGEERAKRVLREQEKDLEAANPRADWLFNPSSRGPRGLTLVMPAMQWSADAKAGTIRLPLDRVFCASCGDMMRGMATWAPDATLTVLGIPKSQITLPSPWFCAQAPGTWVTEMETPTGAAWQYGRDEATIMGAGVPGVFAKSGLDPRAVMLDFTRIGWTVRPTEEDFALLALLPAAFWDSFGVLLQECTQHADPYVDVVLRVPKRRESLDSLQLVQWRTNAPNELEDDAEWTDHVSFMAFGALRETEDYLVHVVPKLSMSRAAKPEAAAGAEEPDTSGGVRISDGVISTVPAAVEEEAEPAPVAEDDPVARALFDLSALVGLKNVKQEVGALIRLQRMRKARKEHFLPDIPVSNHLVFVGPPGSGRSKVASLLSRMYKAMGVLPEDKVVEVDKSGLVSGSAAETVRKTRDVVAKALGGVLLVDEAWELAPTGAAGDYGSEAVGTLVEEMAAHEDGLMVILSGRAPQLKAFLAGSPALRGLFTQYISFEDYSSEDMVRIFQRMCREAGYTLSSDAAACVRRLLAGRCASKDPSFANAREARIFFDGAVRAQADRFFGLESPEPEELSMLRLADIWRGWAGLSASFQQPEPEP